MRYSNRPLPELIDYFRSKGREGDFWDFKQEWHEKMPELIKDIICFANTTHDENCYLIFGIADDLSVQGMLKHRKKYSEILDALSNLQFAGDNLPDIELEAVQYDGVELDVLIIKDTDHTPIYLKKPYGEMMAGCIYARVGDRNTPNKGNAEISIIERLWKKRMGLLKPPLTYIMDSLANKLDWMESEGNYYNIYKPEYTVERREADGAGEDEFYSYAMTNERTSFYMLDIKGYRTTLDSYQIVVLDSGRLSIPVPEWGFIYLDEYHQDMLAYKYYIENTQRMQLLEFMYDAGMSEQKWAMDDLMEVVLVYKSEEERQEFEYYLTGYLSDLQNKIETSTRFECLAIADNEPKKKQYVQRLRTGTALNEMLQEFRNLPRNDME